MGGLRTRGTVMHSWTAPRSEIQYTGSPGRASLSLRVLVADDEHLVAAGVAASVAALGCHTIGPVSDGEAALELGRSSAPDMALLDVRMPRLDGLACAKALWNELGIPSVILTAYASDSYLESAQQTGVFGYLLKPVTTESLRAAIGVAWARAQAHRAQSERIMQLEGTLETRRIVEQAKWRLVQVRGVSEPDAHAMLQRTARSDRRRVVDVAVEVIENPDHPLLKG